MLLLILRFAIIAIISYAIAPFSPFSFWLFSPLRAIILRRCRYFRYFLRFSFIILLMLISSLAPPSLRLDYWLLLFIAISASPLSLILFLRLFFHFRYHADIISQISFFDIIIISLRYFIISCWYIFAAFAIHIFFRHADIALPPLMPTMPPFHFRHFAIFAIHYATFAIAFRDAGEVFADFTLPFSLFSLRH